MANRLRLIIICFLTFALSDNAVAEVHHYKHPVTKSPHDAQEVPTKPQDTNSIENDIAIPHSDARREEPAPLK